jgi:hypothetical protein
MIVRTWHGCVPLQHAEGFARHLERTGVEHAQSIPATEAPWCAGKPGRMGAFLSRHLLAGSRGGQSLRSEDYHVAVTYPDDEAFELLSDPYVFQHEVEAVSPL